MSLWSSSGSNSHCHRAPPGNLLVSPAANPVKEPTRKEITTGRWFSASLRTCVQVLRLLLFTLPRFMEGQVQAEGWKEEAASEYRRFSISHCCSCENTEISEIASTILDHVIFRYFHSSSAVWRLP